MVSIDKSLVTSRYTGAEFKKSSVLNVGVTIDDLNNKVSKNIKKNGMRRRKSQIKAQKGTRF